MSAIAFMMLPQIGHLNASFKIAKRLKQRGHHVSYVGLTEHQDYVRAQGFEYLPIFAELFPQKPERRQPTAPPGVSKLERLRGARREAGKVKSALRGLPGEVDRVAGRGRIDLFIVDSLLPFAALATYKTGVPTLLLSTTFPTVRERSSPPLLTAIVPGRSPFDVLKISLAWHRYFFQRRCARLKLSWLGGLNLKREIKLLARASGYPSKLVNDEALYLPVLDLPELVLCPKELDFPRPEKSARHYIEASVDFERTANSFPWEKLDAGKSLLYCSLGTQSHVYDRKAGKRFLQQVVDAVAARPGWQLVLSIGSHLNDADFHSLAPDTIVVKDAPQLEVLKRASLMITHGGLNSIKECIFNGVPMIVFPLTKDQPGNAARVVYNGLGLMGDVRKATAAQVGALIDAVGRDPSFKIRLEEMRRRFREVEDSGVGVRTVESFLGGASFERHGGVPAPEARRTNTGRLSRDYVE
jgi:UDP:flavonoid glycosyltransferase YjiC (YdhE family)